MPELLPILLQPTSLLVVLPALLILMISPFTSVYFHRSGLRLAKHTPQTRPHLPFFDLIKGFAILSVIAIHVTYLYSLDPFAYFPGSDYYRWCNLANNLFRYTIPIFLMVSGILLTPARPGEWTKFYWRKVGRLLPGYLLVCWAILHDRPWSEILTKTLTGEADVPFYFMITLFQCYLLYPLLNWSRRYPSTLVALFILSVVAAIIPSLWHWGTFPLGLKYLFFFAYGVHARDYFLNFERGQMPISHLLFWVGAVLFYLGYGLLWPERYYNTRFFYGPAVLHLLFYFQAPLMAWSQSWSGRLVELCGRHSLWIFLIHLQIMIWADRTILQSWWQLSFTARNWTLFWVATPLIIVAAVGVSRCEQWLLTHARKLWPIKHPYEQHPPKSKAA